MNGYGIDSAVQGRADANRDNPQRLAESYKNNQNLLDLLALQKIKSEKEAARRQMALDMARKEGKPPTIADQREEQVMDLTKDELVDQRMQQANQDNAERQQNLEQLAQSGIAGAAPRGAAQMADGGIVSFQEGGEADAQRIAEDRSPSIQDVSRGIGSALRSPVDAASWVWDQAGRRSPFTVGDVWENVIVPVGEGMFGVDPEAAKDMSEEELAEAEQEAAKRTNEAQQGQQRQDEELWTPDIVEQEGSGQSQQQSSGQGRDVEMPEVPSPEDSEAYQMGMDMVRQASQRNPQEEARAAGERFRDIAGAEDIENRRSELSSQLEEHFAQMSDPERQERERLISFLTGAGGQSTAAGALGAGAQSSIAYQNQADQRTSENIQTLINNTDKVAQRMYEMGASQMEVENQIRQAAQGAQNTASQVAAELSRQSQASDVAQYEGEMGTIQAQAENLMNNQEFQNELRLKLIERDMAFDEKIMDAAMKQLPNLLMGVDPESLGDSETVEILANRLATQIQAAQSGANLIQGGGAMPDWADDDSNFRPRRQDN